MQVAGLVIPPVALCPNVAFLQLCLQCINALMKLLTNFNGFGESTSHVLNLALRCRSSLSSTHCILIHPRFETSFCDNTAIWTNQITTLIRSNLSTSREWSCLL